MSNPALGRFHALLIGIDKYDRRPLSGCINDIDQVQRFLEHKLAIPPPCIRRLEAPSDSCEQNSISAADRPTYDNLVAALQALAGPQVPRGDRVFIYYSGHGSFAKIPLAETYFEGLVPIDQEEKGLLFDVLLNRLLQNIADRSGDLTVILDCCHAAGATRAVVARPDVTERFLPLDSVTAKHITEVTQRVQELGSLAAERQAPQEYTVVTACHADETAAECQQPPDVGKTHGLFSHCLFTVLDQVEPQTLHALRWSDIWEQLKATLATARPSQHPMLLGPKERRIFGGPWQPQDPGHAVTRSTEGIYRIAAGSLAGLGRGAQLAVYGPQPALFPPLDSAADQQARLGVLTVESVQPAHAFAGPSPKGAATFDIPPAARGRLIKQGAPDLLRVSISQNLDPAIRRFLDESAPRDRFVLLGEHDPAAECRVDQDQNGDIWIGDDVCGQIARIGYEEAFDSEERAVFLRAGLNHYAQYVVPLRACRNGSFALPEQAIEVTLLDCLETANPSQWEYDASMRREAQRDPQRRCYVITSGARVAVHVRNTLAMDLYVFLMLCNLEGKIEILSDDVVVRAHSGKIFWHQNIVGQPFRLVCPAGHRWGIDRLVAIATDRKGLDLSGLAQQLTMKQAIREATGMKSVTITVQNAPALAWTAVQTLIQIGKPD